MLWKLSEIEVYNKIKTFVDSVRYTQLVNIKQNFQSKILQVVYVTVVGELARNCLHRIGVKLATMLASIQKQHTHSRQC